MADRPDRPEKTNKYNELYVLVAGQLEQNR